MEREICLRCGGEMLYIGQEKLQLGQYGLLTGAWSNLFSGALAVDIYCCKDCKKLEFYAVEPPEELRRALSLKALLQGEYKPLAPFIGANYARRNRVMGRAALVAGNLRDASLLPLLQKVAESEASPAREHAAWATQRIMAGDREARPEG